VSDNNPASPTYINGPFGVRNRLVQLRTPQSLATATEAARIYLQRALARQETWRVTMAPDAALEFGDVCLIKAQGRQQPQVVQSFELPLTVEGLMSIQFRSQVVGLVQES
jgi:hypothetical protein